MHIERTHTVGKAEAIRRIDTFLDDLLRRDLPGGVKIKDASKSWVGDAMNFSFKAKKGLLGATISGVIHFSDQTIAMDSELPGLVTTFVGEDRIREVISKQFDELFPES
jgi:Putative polyhydroxyalkanoic acid system protein (PHA_gran_rgn)